MGIRPEDRWKAVTLILAIILVIGYTIYSVMPRLAPKRGSASPIATSMPSAGPGFALTTPSGPASATGEATPARNPNPADLDVESGTIAASGRDPFKPPVPSVVVPPAQPPPTKPPAPSMAGRPSEPILPVWTEPGARIPSGVGPVLISPPAAPAVELKGVIPGEPAIAVLHVGGQTITRQEGEMIADGYIIAKITEAGIVLKRGKRNFLLSVGHSTQPNSAMQPPAPMHTPTPFGSGSSVMPAPAASTLPTMPSLNEPNSSLDTGTQRAVTNTAESTVISQPTRHSIHPHSSRRQTLRRRLVYSRYAKHMRAHFAGRRL